MKLRKIPVPTRLRLTQCALTILLLLCNGLLAASWQATLSKEPVGDFAELRPLSASYRFGWSGLTAATGEVHLTKPATDRFQLDGTGRTIGLVRALWKMDVNYCAVTDLQTLKPIEAQQIEKYRSKKIATHLRFSSSGVTRTRTEGEEAAAKIKSKQFNFPNLFDMLSASLYLRSQPLAQGSTYRLVVYPATNAYLATITVLGREKISVHAGTYKAIKLDLRLKRIGDHLDLHPHKKFRRATIWVSDDAERMILRIEAQVFVGTVFAELQSVHFESPN